MHRCWTLLVVVVAAPYLSGRAAAQVGTDAFLNLPDSQKLQVISAAMDQREARLQRMSYDVVESVRTTNRATGEVEYADDRSFYFARDGALQRQETRGLLKKDEPGAMVSDISVWDGKRLKVLMQFNGLDRYDGTVKDTPTAMLDNMHYHCMLGLRAFNTQRFGPGGRSSEPIMSLGEWVREVAQSDYKVSFEPAKHQGRPVIHLAVEQHFWTWHYTFDPARGWMPVRYERVIKGDDFPDLVSEVAEAREVDGVWVPAVLKERSRGPRSTLEGTWEYRLKEFKTGADVQAEFDFPWPPNTLVGDLIAKVAYRVKADGSTEMVPFIDSQTGQVLPPPSGGRAATSQPAALANPSACPATRPACASQPTVAASVTPAVTPAAAPVAASRLSAWHIAVAGLLVAAAIAAVYLRKRRFAAD